MCFGEKKHGRLQVRSVRNEDDASMIAGSVHASATRTFMTKLVVWPTVSDAVVERFTINEREKVLEHVENY